MTAVAFALERSEDSDKKGGGTTTEISVARAPLNREFKWFQKQRHTEGNRRLSTK